MDVPGGKRCPVAANLLQTMDAGASFAVVLLIRVHNECLKISCDASLTLVEVEVVQDAIAVNDPEF